MLPGLFQRLGELPGQLGAAADLQLCLLPGGIGQLPGLLLRLSVGQTELLLQAAEACFQGGGLPGQLGDFPLQRRLPLLQLLLAFQVPALSGVFRLQFRKAACLPVQNQGKVGNVLVRQLQLPQGGAQLLLLGVPLGQQPGTVPAPAGHFLLGPMGFLSGLIQLGLRGSMLRFPCGIGVVQGAAHPAGHPLGELLGQDPRLLRKEGGVVFQVSLLGLLLRLGGLPVALLSSFQLSVQPLQLGGLLFRLLQQPNSALGFVFFFGQPLPLTGDLRQGVQRLPVPVPLLLQGQQPLLLLG